MGFRPEHTHTHTSATHISQIYSNMAAIPYQGGYHPTNSVLHILGHARAVQIIQDRRRSGNVFIHPQTGCVIATTSLNNNGYATTKQYSNDLLAQKQRDPDLSLRNRGTNLLLHRVAYTAKHGIDINVGCVASHLCDNKACFNPDHVVSETQGQNLERTYCRGVIRCPHHDLHVIVDFCSHTPKCIKVMPDDLSCCLLRTRSPSASVPVRSSASVVLLGSGIVERNPADLPGSQFLHAPEPDDDEESQELPVVRSDAPEPSSPVLGGLPSSPPAPPLGPVSAHTRPSSSSSDPIRAPVRRRLNPPVSVDPSAATSSVLNTSDFVVPDGTQYIQYDNNDDSDEPAAESTPSA